MAETGTDIARAKALLEAGKLVAIPTETVYGLGGNGLDASAAALIFATKKRPAFDPLILHTDSLEKVKGFVAEVPENALKLAREYWPGPLTLILKKQEKIPELVTSGLDTVAVRIPKHPLTLALLGTLDFPLAAPSANPFGYVSPTTPEHVEAQLGQDIEYILDGGPCKVGVESTIVSFEGEQATVLRMGGLSLEALESVLGKVRVNAHSSSTPTAPGMLKSHYAPKKSFVLIDSVNDFSMPENGDFAIIAFNKAVLGVPQDRQFLLSPGGDLDQAASQLFSTMRYLDQRDDINEIIAIKVPEEGLGRAVNDRLKRAAAKE